MNWLHVKEKYRTSKDWIISNQSSDGHISWDKKGKCDSWDHCECLIALSIYEEWDAFWKGVSWFFDNINDDGLIFAEFQNGKPSKKHFESHHAPYIILPLLQASLIDKKQNHNNILSKIQLDKLDRIFKELNNFKDKDGFYCWAKNDGEYSDNSLITASMSIHLSIMAKEFLSPDLNINLWDEKFDRDGVDRSRFSMDFYYPYLAGVKKSKSEFLQVLENFYIKGLGVKCVQEEPWITIAESCECVIAALVHGNIQIAEDIFNDIQQFQDSEGIFPTGYQYDLKIFWPEEKSTWTNAAVIIAAHALSCSKKPDSTQKNVFLELSNFFKSN